MKTTEDPTVTEQQTARAPRHVFAVGDRIVWTEDDTTYTRRAVVETLDSIVGLEFYADGVKHYRLHSEVVADTGQPLVRPTRARLLLDRLQQATPAWGWDCDEGQRTLWSRSGPAGGPPWDELVLAVAPWSWGLGVTAQADAVTGGVNLSATVSVGPVHLTASRTRA